MADYITPEQAQALQDQYNQALANANSMNQAYQNTLNGNSGNSGNSSIWDSDSTPSNVSNNGTGNSVGNSGSNVWDFNVTPGGVSATPSTGATSGSTPSNGYTATGGANGTSLVVSGAGTGNSQAQAIVDNSYNEFIRKLQEISANTGVPMSDLINMAANTPGYGTWTDSGQLVVNDPNTGNTVVSGGGIAAGAGTITPVIPGTGSGTGGTGTGDTGTGNTGIIGGDNSPNIPGFDRTQAIRDMYDAQINAQRAALQESGDQALSDAQANRDKIADLYNTQRNAASVDWERQRRNFLEGAASSGINTGARSQAELSMMGMHQRRDNTLGAAQAQAEAEADRNIADIKRNTQASINEAIAKNDYQKAAALLDEYNNTYNKYMDRAEALAAYGDFSGYAALYGDTAAANMRQIWLMQNPEIALAFGLIDQNQYALLKGSSYYSGYSGYSRGGYYGGSGGGGSDADSTGGGGSQQSLADLANEARAAGATESEILQALEDIYADGNYGPD